MTSGDDGKLSDSPHTAENQKIQNKENTVYNAV